MSCVYMISCRDETIPEIYIGSTSNFIRRRKQHFYSCNNPNSKCYNFKLYRFIRSNGGIDNFVMEILERCYEDEDEDKFEIEKKYIRSYAPELNSHKYEFDKKEYNKEYDNKNKDKKRARNKKVKLKIKRKGKKMKKRKYVVALVDVK